jgi:hypothetical protein
VQDGDGDRGNGRENQKTKSEQTHDVTLREVKKPESPAIAAGVRLRSCLNRSTLLGRRSFFDVRVQRFQIGVIFLNRVERIGEAGANAWIRRQEIQDGLETGEKLSQASFFRRLRRDFRVKLGRFLVENFTLRFIRHD